MKRIKNILIESIFILGFLAVFIFNIPMPCIIKRSIGISCPSCGITRSFYSILRLDFVSAIKYNILGIPLFIFFLISFIVILVDIILNKDTYLKNMNKILQNKVFIIILFLLILLSTIINNVNQV